MHYTITLTPWGANVAGPYSNDAVAATAARKASTIGDTKVVHATARQAEVDRLAAAGWTVRELAPQAP